jgi:hypothetical protein
MQCRQLELMGREQPRGTTVGLLAVPKDGLLVFGGDVFLVFKCTLACSTNGTTHFIDCPGTSHGQGRQDFFVIGPMAAGGGWDEAAWAAKGLPVSGELQLSLTMHSVGS